MNTIDKTKKQNLSKFAEKIFSLQDKMTESIKNGEIEDVEGDCTLINYFTPKSEEYGCHMYAREFTMPKNACIVGKIHRHAHLNFITRGEIVVVTDGGLNRYKAPVTFVSEPGTKRAVFVVEECTWTTVHLTSVAGEENLDTIEDEVIAPSFAELAVSSELKEIAK
jgi:hypothetical protein